MKHQFMSIRFIIICNFKFVTCHVLEWHFARINFRADTNEIHLLENSTA